MNPMNLYQVTQMWSRFCKNHPRFPAFLRSFSQRGIREGMILDLTVTDETGETLRTNIKLTADDIAIIEELKNLQK